MPGKFEIYNDNAGEYRFRLQASNGETVLVSQGYKARSGAKNGIEAVRENADDDDRFEMSTTPTGAYRFSLKAKNNQVIGQSQNYTSASARDNGVKAVARAAEGGKVEELTE